MTSPFAVGGSVPPGGGTARLARGKAEPRYGKVRRGAIERLGGINPRGGLQRHEPLALQPLGLREVHAAIELDLAVQRRVGRIDRDAISNHLGLGGRWSVRIGR